MKKYISLYTILCLLLACISMNAFAAPIDIYETVDGYPFIDSKVNYFESHSSEIQPCVIGLENHLFTMNASSLTKLLTTNNTNKYFYSEKFSDNGDVYFCGTLTSNRDTPYAGICVWSPASSSFVSKFSAEFTSGEFCCSEMIATTQFVDTWKYLGYINGTDTGGTSGSVQYWYLNYDA